MERDDDLTSNNYTTLFRQYSASIGRWKSTDPKGGSFPHLSSYSAMGNNPIKITDVHGDSIPTTFYDVSGFQTNKIPDLLQNQFQQEYGIILGYDNGKLFKAGDYETSSTVSADAKSAWEKELGAENGEHSMVFAYYLSLQPLGSILDINKPAAVPIVDGAYNPVDNTAYIDLGDFNRNGSPLSSKAFGDLDVWSSRTINFARLLEHEFLGHGVNNLPDDPSYLNPTGQTVDFVNVLRSQMGLIHRSQYTVKEANTILSSGRYDMQFKSEDGKIVNYQLNLTSLKRTSTTLKVPSVRIR
ncbi:MAG: RHS repeat-associated protein [Arenicella sp.]|jgi:RHS repeat-associated protein